MRTLGITFLSLVALFVGGCGALVLFGEIFSGPDPHFGSFLTVSIPSLIVGILAGWWALYISEHINPVEVSKYRGVPIRKDGSNYMVYHHSFNNLDDAKDFVDKHHKGGKGTPEEWA